ncbi:putative adhesin [Morganella morganii]
MPVSASQHRVSTGTYQNKFHNTFRLNSATQTQGINPDCPGIPDEIYRLGRSIDSVVNSRGELSAPSTPATSARQGAVAPLLMLLSQVRFDDILPAATTNISVFTSERRVFPSVSRDSAYPDNRDTGFTAVLNPVMNALHETGRFIARHDPLQFPPANASPVPQAGTESAITPAITRNLKSDSYIITGEQKKNELISGVVQYLVSDGQLTADEGSNVELWLRAEAAGMPMVAARLDNNGSGTNRTKRALMPELDPRTGEHIKEHCAFEEEVLDAQGENQGKLLLFEAQRAENPFRMIYDNRPDSRPSPEERGAADGLNIVANIFTLGIKPLIGNLIAHAKRRAYYQNQEDKICAERFRRLFIAEVLTSLDDGGLSYQSASRAASRRIKPMELLHIAPAQDRAAFYTRNPHTGIKNEILLKLKGAVNDNGREVYLKPTEKPNEFFTYYPDAVKPERLERRVIVDESNLSWRYADSFDSSKLNVEISEGKRQIRLHGTNFDLHQNGAGKYEIVVNKVSGIKEFIPVYMEPLSRTWHLSTHNEHAVFSNQQIDIIKEIKVSKKDGFYYTPMGNNNPDYYGSGNIYSQEKIGESGHYSWGQYVEMNGELVPVKTVVTPKHGIHYEVYDLKFPEKNGYLIEWDGNRWLFERKTSVHVSKELEDLILPEMISDNVNAGKLSAPDHQGLRYDTDGNRFIKVDDHFVNIHKCEHRYCIKDRNNDNIFVDFKKNEFILHKNKVTDRFDATKVASIDISGLGVHAIPEYKNIYVTDNGSFYINLNNEYYPVEFAGKDRRVVLIGSPNEIRFACIYKPEDGSLKNIGESLNQSILTYNKDIDVYISSDMSSEKTYVMKFDKIKNDLVNIPVHSVNKLNKQLYKVEFKNFSLYIPQKTSTDVYLAAHAGRNINFSGRIPDNLELKFYTEKGKVLHGHVDDLQDLVNGKFNEVEIKKGGESIESYAISFDHESQINYANLAMESKKSIIKVKENGEVMLEQLLRDISAVFAEDKTIHLYMCRSF